MKVDCSVVEFTALSTSRAFSFKFLSVHVITHVLLSHPHETTLLTVEEEEIDMDSGRKQSGFLPSLIMLIEI